MFGHALWSAFEISYSFFLPIFSVQIPIIAELRVKLKCVWSLRGVTEVTFAEKSDSRDLLTVECCAGYWLIRVSTVRNPLRRTPSASLTFTTILMVVIGVVLPFSPLG
jgi:hypothetical protein